MKNLKSNLAGQWYSDDIQELSEDLSGYMSNVNQDQLENVQAILLPHAGYQYSGQVAAYGINQIKGKTYKRVIVLGPTHRVQIPGFVSIPDVDSIETPLGVLNLDRKFIADIMEYPVVMSLDLVHEQEHSVQIELPMLQYALGDFLVVPIVVGQMDYGAIMDVAYVLANHIDNDTLIVVSSDFTHYGGAFSYLPFTNNIEKNLKKLDMGAFEYIKRKDTDGFLDYISETGATICGRYPIAILLEILTGSSEVHLLKYKTSGHITGDWSHCISYISAAFTGKWE